MPLTKDPAWQRHAKFFDGAFAQLEQRQLSKIRAWADANLAAPKPTMFYMFTGPDFLYANAFYSKATHLCAGRAGAGRRGARPDAAAARRGGRRALQCRALARLDPELLLLHHQADEGRPARQPGQRHLADPLRLPGALGQDHPQRRDGRARRTRAACMSATTIRGRNAVRGVRITFAGSDGRRRRCITSRPISPMPACKASGFLKFCETLAPGNSLLKSASYLLHSGQLHRGARLAARQQRDHHPGRFRNSACVLQSAKQWRFFPFGRYLGPIDEFPGRYQDRYAELFTPRPADRFRHRLSLAHAMNRICCCR